MTWIEHKLGLRLELRIVGHLTLEMREKRQHGIMNLGDCLWPGRQRVFSAGVSATGRAPGHLTPLPSILHAQVCHYLSCPLCPTVTCILLCPTV